MEWYIGSFYGPYGNSLRLLIIIPIPMFKRETDWLESWDIVLQMGYMFVFIFEVFFQLNYCKTALLLNEIMKNSPISKSSFKTVFEFFKVLEDIAAW